MKYAKYEMVMKKSKVHESKYDYQVKSCRDVYEFATKLLRMHEFPEEHFIVLACNAAGRIIGFYEVSKGTLTSASACPREVFRTAINLNAASLLCLHNHPSMIVEPSAEDIESSRRLFEAGKIIGIPILDHIIVGDDDFYSFHANGLLNG